MFENVRTMAVILFCIAFAIAMHTGNLATTVVQLASR